MRLFSTVTKRILLALGYPRFMDIHTHRYTTNLLEDDDNKAAAIDTTSWYKVGAIKLRLPSLTPSCSSSSSSSSSYGRSQQQEQHLPACQIFYPAAVATENQEDGKNTNKKKKHHHNKFVPYFRKEAVTGMIDYLQGFGQGLLHYLHDTAHPCARYYGADPLDPSPTQQSSSTKFPLVLFSHGLGGTLELYTELCSLLASYGYIVVALEHEDGSAAYASSSTTHYSNSTRTSSTNRIPYQRPVPNAQQPYSRHKVLELRTPMLDHRVQELERVYNYFRFENTTNSHNTGVGLPNYENANDDNTETRRITTTTTTRNSTDNKDKKNTEDPAAHRRLLQKIQAVMDPQDVHLLGHSFGGATVLLAAQHWRNTTTTRQRIVPTSILVLDAWCFALPDAVLNRGITTVTTNGNTTATTTTTTSVSTNGSRSNHPTAATAPPRPVSTTKVISILSEDWAFTNREREQTLQFLRNCGPCRSSQEKEEETPTTENHVHSYYAQNSVHQSFSDTECYLPTFVSRKLHNRGPQEPRHTTIRACVHEFLKQQQVQPQQQTSSSSSSTSTITRNEEDKNNDDDKEHTTRLIPFPP